MVYFAQQHGSLVGQCRALPHPVLEHLIEPSERIVGLALRRHVHTRADEADEALLAIEPGRSLVKDPTVLAVVTAQAILHRESAPLDERLQVGLHAAREILG